jgi:O-antigen/teichoic acid export membrane protein
LIAVVLLLSRMLLSFLSCDWEAGRRDEAQARLGFALKLIGLAVTALSIAALLAVPVVFHWALKGKYAEGCRVLPAAMAYCVWFGLLTVAVNYLWCHERPSLACLSIGIGLVVNVVLNYLWLPRWGLSGAVLATAVANWTALASVCAWCHWLGMRFNCGIILSLMMPACLLLGALPAAGCLVIVVWSGLRHGWLFSESERRHLAALAKSVRQRLVSHKIPSNTIESL